MALVLAIEPDLRQAAVLKRIIHEKVKADLVVVDSRDAAMESLHAAIPDVLLLSALLSPRDEDELIAHLRGLDGAEHLQTHTIPQLALRSEDGVRTTAARGLLKAFRRKKEPEPALPGCDPDLFAGEVRTFLQHAAEKKEERRLLRESGGVTHDAGEMIAVNEDMPAEVAVEPRAAASSWESPFEWRSSNPSSLIPNPRIPNRESRIANRESRIPHSESSIPHPQSSIASPDGATDAVSRAEAALEELIAIARAQEPVKVEAPAAPATGVEPTADIDFTQLDALSDSIEPNPEPVAVVEDVAPIEVATVSFVAAAAEPTSEEIVAGEPAAVEQVQVAVAEEMPAIGEPAAIEASDDLIVQPAETPVVAWSSEEHIDDGAIALGAAPAVEETIAEPESPAVAAQMPAAVEAGIETPVAATPDVYEEERRDSVVAAPAVMVVNDDLWSALPDIEVVADDSVAPSTEPDQDGTELSLSSLMDEPETTPAIEIAADAAAVVESTIDEPQAAESPVEDTAVAMAATENVAEEAAAIDNPAAETAFCADTDDSERDATDAESPHDESEMGSYRRLGPLATWVRAERPIVVEKEPQSTNDELRNLMSRLAVPLHVANVAYPRGCRIRRVRVPAARDARKSHVAGPVILSRKALNETRLAGR